MFTHQLSIGVAAGVFLTGCTPPRGHGAVGARPGHTPSTAPQTRPAAPVLIRRNNGHYRVSQPWTVELGGRRWQVQRGYTSNGITGPDNIRKSFGDGVNHPETWAAVFHDWLYTQPGMTRARADAMFYQILIAYGVSPLKSRLMYSGVSAYSASKAPR